MPDPRDPRAPGSDQPPRRPQDEPVAPEPAWTPPVAIEQDDPPFNRERFLLRCVAWVLGVQFSIYILMGLLCAYGAVVLSMHVKSVTDKAVVCPNIADKIRSAAGESLAVLLALLGGGTLAVNEMERRRRPDPRSGDRLPPPR